ncbi:MAG TPA: OsmC family protein [Devosia sp.]|nr:OsmC family protein [Devosia sp.]
MASMSVSLRSIPDTQAAMGWAGGHTVVIDRPDGRAGGLGLGFNGGQMIALAIGGCFCNDLRYMAETMGVRVDTISVDVTIILEGQPPLVVSAEVRAQVQGDGDMAELVRRAAADSTVGNSVQRGFPVTISQV